MDSNITYNICPIYINKDSHQTIVSQDVSGIFRTGLMTYEQCNPNVSPTH